MTNPARCPRRNCGTLLRHLTTGHGKVVSVCDPCERNRQGYCRDCPSRLDKPTVMRCARCRRARTLEQARVNAARRYEELRDLRLAQQREYANRPEVRERRRAYMAEYNATYFGDAAGRRAKQAGQRAWRQSPTGRAKTRDANRRWWEKNKERARENSRRYYRENQELLCAKQRDRDRRRRSIPETTPQQGAA